MPRVSDTDQRLVDTALEMVKFSGLSNLKLRDVAKKAGVNLGMFHYHFKTKDQFTRAVLQDTYEKFFSKFTLETSGDGPALERLRSALMTLGHFVAEHRQMIFGIYRDILNKNKVVLDFAKANAPRHGLVIVGLVRQCQKEGSIRKMPMLSIMPMLMGSCFFPLLLMSMLEHLEVKAAFVPLALMKKSVVSDKALGERVDLALEALAPRKGGKK